jgi:hypothetical protein
MTHKYKYVINNTNNNNNNNNNTQIPISFTAFSLHISTSSLAVSPASIIYYLVFLLVCG